jgi:tetratricopeptide (TPR) repeat protein
MNKRTHMNFSTLNIALVALLLISGKTKAQSPALVQAIKLTDNEQFDKASSAFKTLLAKDAANADTYFYFGENLLAAEKADSAEILFKKGIEVNATMPLNHIGLAKVYRSKGKNTEAQTSFDKAFALFTEKGVKVKDEMKVRTYVEGAECMLLGSPKNTSKALELIKKALELDENNVAAYITKGDALFEADPLNATDPIAAYKTAYELDKSSPKALARQAYMWFRARQYQKAVDLYTEAIKTDANFAPAYSGRGEALYYVNKLEEGIKDFEKYLEMNKGNINARIRYAGFLHVAKKYDEAMNEVNAIEKAIGTDHVLLNRLKAYVLYEKTDYANALKAMEYYMQKQASDKINATDYEYLGRIQWKLGNDAERDKNLEKAIDMDYKGKSTIIAEIIAAYKEKKDNVKQIYWYKKKIKNGSKDVNDWYYMGLCAYNADNYGLCDTAFTEYTKVMPDFAMAYYYLGWAKDGLDKDEPKRWDAKASYEMFVSKLKPEEMEKNAKKLSEAYFYYARFHYFSSKDYAMSKCYATKVVTMNASETWATAAKGFLNYKEIIAATAAAECK